MKKFNFFLSLSLLVLFGCASHSESSPIPQPPIYLYLTDEKNIPSAIRKFHDTRDLTTEEGKIDYLLGRVQSSGLSFIRNRETFPGPAAAAFLREKIGWYEGHFHVPIKTADAFVAHVAKGSTTTGLPYEVILGNGKYENLQRVLRNELDALNSCLEEFCYQSR